MPPMTSDLIGRIKNALADSSHPNAIVYELIQNAADANATEVDIHITEEAFTIWNDASFLACANIEADNCAKIEVDEMPDKQRDCDFHALLRLDSHSKEGRKGQIGRFGSGFSSVFHLTDEPSVTSNGYRLVLSPTQGEGMITTVIQEAGTVISLPWARNAESDLRRGLKKEPVRGAKIESLYKDISLIIKTSLIFMPDQFKNLESVTLRKNGEHKQSVSATKVVDGEKTIKVTAAEKEPRVERWLVLERESEQANNLRNQYPDLADLDSRVSIAIPIESQVELDGRIFAYLPTEFRVGLPCHINGMFRTRQSRKELELDGDSDSAKWNKALLKEAYTLIGDNLSYLRDRLGHQHLWKLLDAAHKHYKDKTRTVDDNGLAAWPYLKPKAEQAEIVRSSEGAWVRPSSDIICANGIDQNDRARTLEKLFDLTATDLDDFHETLKDLGVSALDLATLVKCLQSRWEKVLENINNRNSNSKEELFHGLWNLLESILRDKDIKERSALVGSLKDLAAMKLSVRAEGTPAESLTKRMKNRRSLILRVANAYNCSKLLKFQKVLEELEIRSGKACRLHVTVKSNELDFKKDLDRVPFYDDVKKIVYSDSENGESLKYDAAKALLRWAFPDEQDQRLAALVSVVVRDIIDAPDYYSAQKALDSAGFPALPLSYIPKDDRGVIAEPGPDPPTQPEPSEPPEPPGPTKEEIGKKAEKWVKSYLREERGWDLDWVAPEDLGWDLQESAPEPRIFVEVKCRQIGKPVEITPNEWNGTIEKTGQYYLAIVYNVFTDHKKLLLIPNPSIEIQQHVTVDCKNRCAEKDIRFLELPPQLYERYEMRERKRD